MLFAIAHSSPRSCALVLSNLRSEQSPNTCIQWIRTNLPDKKQMWRQSGSADRLPILLFLYFMNEWFIWLTGTSCLVLQILAKHVRDLIGLAIRSYQNFLYYCWCMPTFDWFMQLLFWIFDYSFSLFDYSFWLFDYRIKYSKYLLAVEMWFLLLETIFCDSKQFWTLPIIKC